MHIHTYTHIMGGPGLLGGGVWAASRGPRIISGAPSVPTGPENIPKTQQSAKYAPRRTQYDRTGGPPRSPQEAKLIDFLFTLLKLFSVLAFSGSRQPKTALWASQIAQRRPKRGPHEGPKTALDGRKTAQEALTTAQEGPKRGLGGLRLPTYPKTPSIGSKKPQEAPRGFQEAPKKPPRSIPRYPKMLPTRL